MEPDPPEEAVAHPVGTIRDHPPFRDKLTTVDEKVVGSFARSPADYTTNFARVIRQLTQGRTFVDKPFEVARLVGFGPDPERYIVGRRT